MPNTLVLIVGAIGCLGLAVGYFCMRSARKTGHKLAQVRKEIDALHEQLEAAKRRHRNEIEDANRRYQQIIDAPPLPTDPQFASHLVALGARLSDCAHDLEDWRVKSAAPFAAVSAELEHARTVSRRERFTRYRDSLQSANIEISRRTERLLAAHAMIEAMVQSFAAGDLGSVVGCAEIAAIETVLNALEHEEWPSDDVRGLLYRETAEIRSRRALYDRANESERRERNEDRAAAAVAFSRYKLPPLTPLEKFRSLKSGGQRDGFS